MKFLLFALLSAALFSSCATMVPLDPMTGSPCPRCSPGNFAQHNQDCYSSNEINGSK